MLQACLSRLTPAGESATGAAQDTLEAQVAGQVPAEPALEPQQSDMVEKWRSSQK